MRLVALAAGAAVGFASGLRSQSGMAAVALTAPPGRTGLDAVVAHPATRVVSGLAAAGELIGDKLPSAPSRLAPMGFVPRLVLGASSSALLARRGGGSVPIAAATGAAAAGVGSWLGAQWRRVAADRFGTDWPGAVLEDVATVAVCTVAVRAHHGVNGPLRQPH